MKKNAFTLIELLAVIVILAIIALIAVPIVINIISDSKYESQKRSIDHYASALKDAIASYQLKNNVKIIGRFNTTDGRILTKDDITLNVDYKGKVICNRIVVNQDASIYLSECKADGDFIYINQEESKKENPTKYYEYGKTEYGMIMENKNHSSEFLNTGIMSYNISYFSISNTLDIENKETYESTDCSYNQDESVICYFKEINSGSGYYDFVLTSDGEMYTPNDSSYLFYGLGHSYYLYSDIDLSNLNTKYTTNMSHMFYNTGGYLSSYKLILGDKFDTSKVTDMSYMFYGATLNRKNSFTLPDCFDTSNVTNMSHMFDSTYYVGNLKLGSNFNTSKVTDMSYMFNSAGRDYMEILDLGDKFDTSNVINMEYMFSNAGENKMTRLDLGKKFDTSKVTNMHAMFYQTGKKLMTSLNLGNKFDTSNVANMQGMFCETGYEKMTSLDLGNKFDTSNVTNMEKMFYETGYKELEELVLGDKFDTSKVTNMEQMFMYTGLKLKKLDLGKNFVITSGLNTYASQMFYGTGRVLEELYLWNFDYSKASYYGRSNIFKDCGTEGTLTKIVVSSNDIKTRIMQLTSPNDIPDFWKENNIIVVEN